MIFSITTLKLLVANAVPFLNFLWTFVNPPAEDNKPRTGVLVILLLGLAAFLYLTINYTLTLSEQEVKDKAKIVEVKKTIGELSLKLSQAIAAKERKIDKVGMLEAQLKSSDASYSRLHNENLRLYNQIDTLKKTLAIEQTRTFTCKPYTPSMDILNELEGLSQE